MMINPPIDKLIKKASCRYELVAGVAARAKQLITQQPEMLENTKEKPLTIAAKEIYEDKIKVKMN